MWVCGGVITMGVWTERLSCSVIPRCLSRSACLSILLATALTVVTVLYLFNERSFGLSGPISRLVTAKTSESSGGLRLEERDLEGAPAHHPDLIAYIKKLHLKPPATGPYNLRQPNLTHFSQQNQSIHIATLFGMKRGGVFLEAGAYDGESLSNTLYLERVLGWRGLLVEADPMSYYTLSKKGRKAHTINACLSPSPFPRELTYKRHDVYGRIARKNEAAGNQAALTRVKCFPLYSILLALNNTHINFFSLDIEGDELKILRTVPWDKVQIDVLCVEHTHIREGGQALRTFMEEQGYDLHSNIGEDHIFVRKGFKNTNVGLLP